MNVLIKKMCIDDLKYILLSDFDDFWTEEVLRGELLSSNSYYIIAKLEDSIVGFAGIKFLLDEAHITNIVTKIDKRNNRYWFNASTFFN